MMMHSADDAFGSLSIASFFRECMVRIDAGRHEDFSGDGKTPEIGRRLSTKSPAMAAMIRFRSPHFYSSMIFSANQNPLFRIMR
jgi:hypothetical protein